MLTSSLVHVIDDDPRACHALERILQAAGFECEMYGSVEQFTEDMKLERPGCIISDLNMPEMDGRALLQYVKAIRCDLPVIIVTGCADPMIAVELMKLGASDFLPKPAEPTDLLAAVRTAVHQSVTSFHQRREMTILQRRFNSLSERERELLALIVQGQSSKQIAYALNISIKTVTNHRAHIMAKMMASNAVDLARLSISVGIPLRAAN